MNAQVALTGVVRGLEINNFELYCRADLLADDAMVLICIQHARRDRLELGGDFPEITLGLASMYTLRCRWAYVS